MRLGIFVAGEPKTEKSGTRSAGLRTWQNVLQTKLEPLATVSHKCEVRLEFLLPKELAQEKNPKNQFGGDVDNLAVVILDALSGTVLKPAGGDGAVHKLVATKRFVERGETAGVWITVTV